MVSQERNETFGFSDSHESFCSCQDFGSNDALACFHCIIGCDRLCAMKGISDFDGYVGFLNLPVFLMVIMLLMVFMILGCSSRFLWFESFHGFVV